MRYIKKVSLDKGANTPQDKKSLTMPEMKIRRNNIKYWFQDTQT